MTHLIAHTKPDTGSWFHFAPYDPGRAGQISADGHSAIVEWQMRGDSKLATKRIDTLTAATAAVARAHPRFYVGEAGSISSGKALSKTMDRQLAQAGERSIPLTLAVLLVVFGAIVAAGLPLLLALSAVAGTMGLLALASQLVPMDEAVKTVVLLIGLAVGVDYSLFQRRAGDDAGGGLEPMRDCVFCRQAAVEGFADAAEDEDVVVHREAEEDHEHESPCSERRSSC